MTILPYPQRSDLAALTDCPRLTADPLLAPDQEAQSFASLLEALSGAQQQLERGREPQEKDPGSTPVEVDKLQPAHNVPAASQSAEARPSGPQSNPINVRGSPASSHATHAPMHKSRHTLRTAPHTVHAGTAELEAGNPGRALHVDIHAEPSSTSLITLVQPINGVRHFGPKNTDRAAPAASAEATPGLIDLPDAAESAEAVQYGRSRAVEAVLSRLAAQANNSPVLVALHAMEAGVRVYARVGQMEPVERDRLRAAVGALLAEHGVPDAELVLDVQGVANTGPQGDGA
jgi:hypothetical protein